MLKLLADTEITWLSGSAVPPTLKWPLPPPKSSKTYCVILSPLGFDTVKSEEIAADWSSPIEKLSPVTARPAVAQPRARIKVMSLVETMLTTPGLL